MKQFTIDNEIVDLLEQEANMSRLVNELLHNYYFETAVDKKTRIMKKIQELKTKKAEIAKEEEELKKEVKSFKEVKNE